MPNRITAHIALFTVALFYAANYLIAKSVMNDEYIGPLGFVLLRVFWASVLFWLVSLFVRGPKVERSDWLRFALCGLTGAAANQMLFFSGLELTTPVHASLILTTSPILVLLFSNLMLKTPVTWRKVVGIATGFAGALALVGLGKPMGDGENILVGDLFIVGNATAYALYLVLVKKLINKYPPLTVMKWVFTTGLIFVIPFGLGQLGEIEWSRFTPYTWGAVLYVIICVTFLAYLLNIYALQRVSPATVGFYIYLQPLLAAFMSAIVGMESIDAVKVISGVLIFFGVFLVSDIPLKPRKSTA